MRAYAILDGGGVKGAALAGCLQAAKDRGIEFKGYGGTSAGSIVALLACVGFEGEELQRIMVKQVEFTEFLDDSGTSLEVLKSLADKFRSSKSKFSLAKLAWTHRSLLRRLNEDLGLYNAKKLQNFLLDKVKEKKSNFKDRTDITFYDLQQAGCPPLKIVVSDLGLRKPIVYSANPQDSSGSVIDAVRASMSYPFVFRPVPINNRYLVDGGLSSNLPVFLFEEERRVDGLPVIAFDLVPSENTSVDEYTFRQFCGDMLATALESGDYLQRQILHGVYHVRIPVPKDIGTLDFSISETRRQELFTVGHSATHAFFSNSVPQWGQAINQVERLQALYASPDLVVPVLEVIAKAFETNTPARNVRSHIMLPTDRGTRIVVYQYGMDTDPDSDLDLDMDAGCTGKAWSTRLPQFADLVDARTSFAPKWKMTKPQQSKIRGDRKAMFSIPMFDLGRSSLSAQDVDHLEILGILSVDTDTQLNDTLWVTDKKEFVFETGRQWADILARILS